jgi:DNA-binding MarR family transcriptional regulator
VPTEAITNNEYQALADVRYRIRRFLAFSEAAAREEGVEPQQHQLLLAIRGLPDTELATIKTVADRLQIKHHSAVELVSRAIVSGLVSRRTDPDDARRASLHLTRRGAAVLERLSHQHREELAVAGGDLVSALRTLMRETKESHER